MRIISGTHYTDQGGTVAAAVAARLHGRLRLLGEVIHEVMHSPFPSVSAKLAAETEHLSRRYPDSDEDLAV